jgi:hypothetical protein
LVLVKCLCGLKRLGILVTSLHFHFTHEVSGKSSGTGTNLSSLATKCLRLLETLSNFFPEE